MVRRPLLASLLFLLSALPWSASAKDCPNATKALDAMDYVTAETEARACLKELPDDADLAFLLSRALGFQGKFDQALSVLVAPRKAAPLNNDFLLWNIHLLLWKGSVDEAAELATTISEKRLKLPEVVRLLGDVAFYKKDYKTAIQHYDAILATPPPDPDVLRNRGLAHKELGNTDAATADFNSMCELQGPASQGCRLADELAPQLPVAPEKSCVTAISLLQTRDYAAAEAAARECLANDPGNPETLFVLSRAIGFQGRDVEALETNRQALERTPTSEDYLTWQVRLLLRQNRIPEAIATSAPLLSSNAPDALQVLGDLHFAQQRCDQAVSYYTRYMATPNPDPNALRNRGLCLKEQGDSTGAKADFDRMCQLEGPSSQGCRLLEEIRESESLHWKLAALLTWQAVENRGDGQVVELDASVRLNPNLWILGIGEFRRRTYAAGADNDILLQGGASYRFRPDFGVMVLAGGTPGADYSPVWTAQIEAWYRVWSDLFVYLKFWHIEFAAGGVEVISPRVEYFLGPLAIDFRYYLSIKDDGSAPVSNAFILTGAYSLGDLLLRLGVGFGDRADYLEYLERPSDRFWLLRLGARYELSDSNAVVFDYVYRNETADPETFRLHEFTLGFTQDF